MIKEMKETTDFCLVLEKINHRYIILESVNPMEQGYYTSKSKELIKMIETIFKQTKKPATNEVALAIAEQLKKTEVDQQVLIKELADRIKIAVGMMVATGGTSSFNSC